MSPRGAFRCPKKCAVRLRVTLGGDGLARGTIRSLGAAREKTKGGVPATATTRAIAARLGVGHAYARQLLASMGAQTTQEWKYSLLGAWIAAGGRDDEDWRLRKLDRAERMLRQCDWLIEALVTFGNAARSSDPTAAVGKAFEKERLARALYREDAGLDTA